MSIRKIWRNEKYLELAWEQKLWNMNMIVIPVIVGGLGIISKGLEKRDAEQETRGRIKTIESTLLL